MCVALPLMSLSIPTNMLMQSTGKSLEATILACARQGIFYLPIILILPKMVGLLGVQLAQPLSDALTLVISSIFLVLFLRKLKEGGRSGTTKDSVIEKQAVGFKSHSLFFFLFPFCASHRKNSIKHRIDEFF